MIFNISEKIQSEIIHHYDSDSGDMIKSTGNSFSIITNKQEINFLIPGQIKFLMNFRIIRRFLRYDKANAVFNWKRDGVVVLYQWKIYFFDLQTKQLNFIDNLKQCRNVLHGGLAVTSHGIYFGEYGHNQKRDPVPIWKSGDDGRNFKIIKELTEQKIKHIHGIYSDKFSESLWIVTGDFDGECFVIEVSDQDFLQLKWHGDGSQKWRPVSLFFMPEKVIWVMDSPIQKAYLQIFDRKDGSITEGQYFPGPVWYSKQFESGDAILQTSVEIGDEVKSKDSIIFYSNNLVDWEEVYRFKKDFLPMPFFKFGVIAFADGKQSKDDFVLFGEALSFLDGVAIKASIK